jgi:hypothetical protein
VAVRGLAARRRGFLTSGNKYVSRSIFVGQSRPAMSFAMSVGVIVIIAAASFDVLACAVKITDTSERRALVASPLVNAPFVGAASPSFAI